MPKQINYSLNEEQLAQVEKAIAHDPRAEVVRRATALRLLHTGQGVEGVAQIMGVSRACVQNWHQRWREGGMVGLVNKPLSGRPSKATVTYREKLEETLECDPHTMGYAFSVWTLERLSQHLERETGIALSAGRLSEWMSRWGYRYRQPKTDLRHKQDASVRQQVQTWLEELKKQPKTGLANFSLWMKPPSV